VETTTLPGAKRGTSYTAERAAYRLTNGRSSALSPRA
jgi:hypothetical protein